MSRILKANSTGEITALLIPNFVHRTWIDKTVWPGQYQVFPEFYEGYN